MKAKNFLKVRIKKKYFFFSLFRIIKGRSHIFCFLFGCSCFYSYLQFVINNTWYGLKKTIINDIFANKEVEMNKIKSENV